MKAFIHAMIKNVLKNRKLPIAGKSVFIRGERMTIRSVRPMGTIDVEDKAGNWYRVTGLNF